MTVRDTLITLLRPEIGEAQAIVLLSDFIKVSIVRGEQARTDVLAQAANRVADLPTANDGQLIYATRDQILTAIRDDQTV